MSVKRIIFRIAVIILIVETLIMIMLNSIHYEFSALVETAIDSFLLVCLSTPLIYVWIMIPFKHDREQEQDYLFQKSRMAQMGELLSMIAHQWRQPLAAISARAIKTRVMIELECSEVSTTDGNIKCTENILKDLTQIDSLVQGLSMTINDFRDFYKPNKEISITSLEDPVIKALNIVRESLSIDGIRIVENYDNKDTLRIYTNEIMQVVLNILKNAQDNFKERKIVDPTIHINTIKTGEGIRLQVCDNGGGIDKAVLPEIFDPYFSTKGEKNGTGLGLYMCKIIIEKHHHGKFSAENTNGGVCFNIVV